MVSGVIGSEFLPHLDEGAIWARAHAGAQHRTRPKAIARHESGARVIWHRFPK